MHFLGDVGVNTSALNQRVVSGCLSESVSKITTP